jgi:membrane protein YqaA with SNARE-associated domain
MTDDATAPDPAADADPCPDADVAECRCTRCEMEIDADAEFCEHCGAKVGPHQQVPWWQVHRRVYDWTLAWAYRPSASLALFVLSFAESSFFPVPPDVLLMPLTLGNRKRWAWYAGLCSLASVLGAVGGFLIGALLWEGGVDQLFYTYVPSVDQEGFEKVSRYYSDWNFWIVFTAGFTPIPFKLITITAGVFATSDAVVSTWGFFGIFVLASAISRSARFFLVAGLMRRFGARITPFIDKYFNWLALLFTALLIGGFVVVKYVIH